MKYNIANLAEQDKKFMKDFLDKSGISYAEGDYGEIGELFLESFMKDLGVVKIRESKVDGIKNPDFNVNLCGYAYKMELKTLQSFVCLSDILNDLDIDFNMPFSLDLSRTNINLSDYDKVKQEIINILSNKKPIEQVVQGTGCNYVIKFVKRNRNSFVWGGSHERPTSNLKNQIFEKKDQMNESDIVSFIVMNKFIESKSFTDELYCLTSDDTEMSFSSLRNPGKWKILENPKLILAIYLAEREVFYIQNIRENNRFDESEIVELKTFWKNKGFLFKELCYKKIICKD